MPVPEVDSCRPLLFPTLLGLGVAVASRRLLGLSYRGAIFLGGVSALAYMLRSVIANRPQREVEIPKALGPYNAIKGKWGLEGNFDLKLLKDGSQEVVYREGPHEFLQFARDAYKSENFESHLVFDIDKEKYGGNEARQRRLNLAQQVLASTIQGRQLQIHSVEGDEVRVTGQAVANGEFYDLCRIPRMEFRSLDPQALAAKLLPNLARIVLDRVIAADKRLPLDDRYDLSVGSSTISVWHVNSEGLRSGTVLQPSEFFAFAPERLADYLLI
jgi:hypothetical protein